MTFSLQHAVDDYDGSRRAGALVTVAIGETSLFLQLPDPEKPASEVSIGRYVRETLTRKPAGVTR